MERTIQHILPEQCCTGVCTATCGSFCPPIMFIQHVGAGLWPGDTNVRGSASKRLMHAKLYTSV